MPCTRTAAPMSGHNRYAHIKLSAMEYNNTTKELIYMSIKCTVVIHKEDNWYVATDISSGVASQGKTIDEASDNLREALSLYYEDNKPTQADMPTFYVTTMEVAI